MAEGSGGSGWEAGGLIGGILGAVGSGLGWGAASWQKDTASAASSKAWRRMMFADNTAVVRRMQDLKNAGINPILAAAGGGAGSPSIGPSMAPGVNEDIVGSFERGVGSAREAQIQKATLARAKFDAETASSAAAIAKVDERLAELRKEFEIEGISHNNANLVRQGTLLEAQKASTDAMTARTNVENAYRQAELVEQMARSKWIQENPFLYNLEQSTRAIAPGISGAKQVGESLLRRR